VGQLETSCKGQANPGASCTFEGTAGTCSVAAIGMYCNIWPIPSTTPTTIAPTPATTVAPTIATVPSALQGCKFGEVGGCTVVMPDGTSKTGTCQLYVHSHSGSFPNVQPQQISVCGIANDCDAAGSGDACTFEGLPGTCQGHSFGSQAGICDVWQPSTTSTTPAPPTTKAYVWPSASIGEDPTKACEHLMGRRNLPLDFDFACSVDMGVGSVAKAGLCTQWAHGQFWCKVGQTEKPRDCGEMPTSADGKTQAAGDQCMFAGKEGTCDKHHVFGAYCNIWPVKALPPNSLKTEVKKGSAVLPVVSNAGFQIGQEIVIDAGTAIEETNTIIGFGSLILKYPLKYDHAAGMVVGVKPLADEKNRGETAPVDAAGFKEVTSLCCPESTEAFFNRLLDKMGLKGCSVPHVQGLMHWFTCVPDMDFQYLVDVINRGNPCKYWALKDATCPVLSAQCGGTWCR